jgi:hypothetical protein
MKKLLFCVAVSAVLCGCATDPTPLEPREMLEAATGSNLLRRNSRVDRMSPEEFERLRGDAGLSSQAPADGMSGRH